MPRKQEIDLEDDEPPTVEPYKVLGIEKSASADEVKSAYRKAALKHHPDKATPETKDEATLKFQEIAFAYAVLSDPVRRKRYDVTGSTAESIDFEDFSWSEFYSEQFRDVITTESIEAFSRQYKGSDEEKDDLLNAYEKFKGSWGKIYATVMLSNPLEDEDRYRVIIDEAIEKGEVKAHKAYTQETKVAKERRMKDARKEGKEAEEYAEKLGLKDKLNGKKADGGLGDLAALIQKRQAGRGNFLDHLEAKYKAEAKKPKGKRGKKRVSEDEEDDEGDMPSEEAFQAAAARLKTGAAEGGRKTKRTKH
ncbi:DnaJ-domain-containing protein [Stipitochalara longipes BDJ]|nr:DnaJ-domain-containing protein [Stipitochalara longipes BDJ]